jgi:hypothetical protein
MSKTRVNCPNCRQPITADINQIFDVSNDPSAKQRLLSGSYNQINCPICGYQGNLSTPIVYHDADKELLLTFIPPEIGLPLNEQERLLGGLINQIVNNLAQEKRKGYLLRPQPVLTMQGLVERVLEADGITHDMIQAQQQRLNLVQRLLGVTPDVRDEIIKQEDKLIDSEFFNLISRLAEASLASGDQASAQGLAELQKSLLASTSFGRELSAQAKEVEAAVADLQAAGKGLTRDKLLDLIIRAPNETRLEAYVSLARPGMDYSFFQLLSERIDRARGDGRTRLVELREKLLQMTQEVDEQMAKRAQAAHKLLDLILQAPNPEEALYQSLPAVDEIFLQELNKAIDAAHKDGDLEKSAKLQRLVDTLEEASAPPPEVALIEELIDAPDDAARKAILDEHKEEITPEFLDSLTRITAQVDSGQDKELADRIKAVYRLALRVSMQMNLK